MRGIRLYSATVLTTDYYAMSYTFTVWARSIAQAYKRLTNHTNGQVPNGWRITEWRV